MRRYCWQRITLTLIAKGIKQLWHSTQKLAEAFYSYCMKSDSRFYDFRWHQSQDRHSKSHLQRHLIAMILIVIGGKKLYSSLIFFKSFSGVISIPAFLVLFWFIKHVSKQVHHHKNEISLLKFFALGHSPNTPVRKYITVCTLQQYTFTFLN